MKPLLLLCLLLVASLHARAYLDPIIGPHLAAAQNVYLVRVASVDGNKISFTVTEVLRGKLVPSVLLTLYPDGPGHRHELGSYPLKSEWLLVSDLTGSMNAVGWTGKENCGWIPGVVVRNGGNINIYLKDWPPKFPGDKRLTLADVKAILKETTPQK